MTDVQTLPLTTLPPLEKEVSPLALGGSFFGEGPWQATNKVDLTAAMESALQLGINHFDTAADYGNGASERAIGEFLKSRREQVVLASKANVDEMNVKHMLEQVDKSLERLETDVIDLFYIHWPRRGKDLRPLMEALMLAKQQGKIRAIGVSNFSVAQMEQVSEVGQINAHQLGYNLFWRLREKDVIPYCREKGIALITYSSIAQGSLTGKFPRDLKFGAGDQRTDIVLFSDKVWPHLFDAIEQLKALAREIDRPLVHLAIRWVLHQEGVHTAVVGAKSESQVRSNVAALKGEIPAAVFDRMTEISDEVTPYIPSLDNMYDYHP